MSRHYPNAPISEAIIAIKATTSARREDLAAMNADRQEEYPTREELQQTLAQIEVSGTERARR